MIGELLEGAAQGVGWLGDQFPGARDAIAHTVHGMEVRSGARVAADAQRAAFADCIDREEARAEAFCDEDRLPNGHLARDRAECMSMWADGVADTVTTEGSHVDDKATSGAEVSGGGSTELSGGLGPILQGKASGHLEGKLAHGNEVQSGSNRSTTRTTKGFEGFNDRCASGVGLTSP